MGQQVPVAVVDPLPAYRAGMATVLSSGHFSPQEPADLLAWVHLGGPQAVVLTLQPLDVGCRLIRQLRDANRELIVVSVACDPSPPVCRQALQAGSHAVVARDAPPRTVMAVLEAALERQCVMPLAVAQALTVEQAPNAAALPVTHVEAEWLQILATGRTVAELAVEVGYSERQMYRMLTATYRRMHVATRAQALVAAARLGLLG